MSSATTQDPPAHAVVLSINEKSQIQALNRTQPGLPMKAGRAGTADAYDGDALEARLLDFMAQRLGAASSVHERIAAHHRAARQEHAQVTAQRVGGVEAAFLPHVPVQLDGRSALEQHGGKAGALRDDFRGLEHVAH